MRVISQEFKYFNLSSKFFRGFKEVNKSQSHITYSLLITLFIVCSCSLRIGRIKLHAGPANIYKRATRSFRREAKKYPCDEHRIHIRTKRTNHCGQYKQSGSFTSNGRDWSRCAGKCVQMRITER